MKLHANHTISHRDEAPRNLWNDSRAWWVNCLGLERYWFYGGQDLHVARGRRDAMLARMVESL
jgi:hypothetical protein